MGLNVLRKEQDNETVTGERRQRVRSRVNVVSRSFDRTDKTRLKLKFLKS